MTDPYPSARASPGGPAAKGTGDLADAVAALDTGPHHGGPPKRRLARSQARGLITLLLIGLLVGSAFELLTLTPTDRDPLSGSRASIVFSNARSGACLGWPPDAPDKPSFVQCRNDHMFEVAQPVGVADGGEPCQLAVREYLGARYDPNGRFAVSVLSAGDVDGGDTGPRNALCGLQLLGPGGKPIPFKGRIVELDQSKVWPVGTCLGVDSSRRSTDTPVDCGAAHGLEVTGEVSLAAAFPGAVPDEAEQRAFIDAACTQAADAYLAPSTLPRSGYALGYEPLSAASWDAGSRQVSCNIGKPAEGGWTTLTVSARAQSSPAAPAPAPPSPASSEDVPPPVYGEPLIPVGPVPGEASPPPPGPGPSPETPTPTPSSSEATPTTTTVPPSTGPLPGPETPPSESTGPTPGILEIPGLPPITLPGYVPPAPG